MIFGEFQSTWSKFFKYFELKTYFIGAMVIFEAGSLICAVAQNSTTFIVRAFGGAGIATKLDCLLLVRPPRRRRRLRDAEPCVCKISQLSTIID
jgi:hypothetical protein